MPTNFNGLTRALVEEALNIVLPSVDWAMDDGVVKRSHGCFVVLDPRIPYEPKYKSWRDPKFIADVVLHRHTLGDVNEWEHPYNEVALAKAYGSWKRGLPMRLIQQAAPYLYQEDWTKWPGSAVGLGGMVVAFSGVEDYFDEMFSEMLLAAIKGICMREVHGPDGVMADADITFLGKGED